MNHEELWKDVTRALAEVCSKQHQAGAAVYLARHNDYLGFDRVAWTGREVNTSLALPSYDVFRTILELGMVTVPTSATELSWLDPAMHFAAPHAALFAHETIGGNLFLAVFLSDRPSTRPAAQHLQQFASYELFPYVATAMFGIELDYLTAEVGHLMGRATAKIAVGTRALRATFTDCQPKDAEDATLAYQAIDEGLRRLDLIRHNFYHFGVQRRAVGSARDAANDLPEEEFDVIQVLKEMTKIFQAESRNTRLKTPVTKLIAKHALIRGPRDLLQIAFLNLYDNAVKFSYANTYVTITAAVSHHRCIVTFENLGIGVAPDEVGAVFQRLRRSRFKDPHRRIEGLGLGLAYCRRVIDELFRGHISLTSRPVETKSPRRFEGDNWLTTVTVELPLAAER